MQDDLLPCTDSRIINLNIPHGTKRIDIGPILETPCHEIEIGISDGFSSSEYKCRRIVKEKPESVEKE